MAEGLSSVYTVLSLITSYPTATIPPERREGKVGRIKIDGIGGREEQAEKRRGEGRGAESRGGETIYISQFCL